MDKARPNGDRSGGVDLVARLVDDVINGGDTRLLPMLVSPDHVTHDPTGDLYGPEGVRIDIAGYRTAFPDLEMTTDDLLADGDLVARRFTIRGAHTGPFLGIAPSGQPVTLTGLAVHRIAEGRLVETWISYDCLGLVRQVAERAADPARQPHAD